MSDCKKKKKPSLWKVFQLNVAFSQFLILFADIHAMSIDWPFRYIYYMQTYSYLLLHSSPPIIFLLLLLTSSSSSSILLLLLEQTTLPSSLPSYLCLPVFMFVIIVQEQTWWSKIPTRDIMTTYHIIWFSDCNDLPEDINQPLRI